ncbi:hypothetical protein FSARC_12976 [Fusarium sarcochroum]|uniref:Uncharacterized protein n=1 Tax=Fusarium sarcochroum TaxID=1208366 RepID=A0A8H4T4P8_9HYPO|nr:hypothetical protein FSARC_12976 [Fusarium sarcochroum]
MWPNAHHLISPPNNYEPIEDEERQSSDSNTAHTHDQSPWKPQKLMPITRKTLCLLIADLVLFGIILHLLSPLISLLQHNDELFSARVKVSSGHLPKSFTPKDPQIPRILHQTTKNGTIPSIWVGPQESCFKAYSSYEYKVRCSIDLMCRVDVDM